MAITGQMVNFTLMWHLLAMLGAVFFILTNGAVILVSYAGITKMGKKGRGRRSRRKLLIHDDWSQFG